MVTFIIRRLIQSAIVLILVTILVFLALRLLPGDPVRMYLTSNSMQELSEEQIEAVRREFGLNKPLVMQYFDWIGGVVRGDLGISILTRVPVAQEIARRVPITLYIGIISFIIGLILGIPAGVIGAVRRGTWIDSLITTLANIGITIPVFWLGILLIYFLGLYLKLLPVMGYTSPFTDFWMSIKQIIMPVICLALFPIAGNARQARSSMLEVMRQDYIRTAWAKGLRERAIIMRHALKNGLIPIVTLSGMGVGTILGGSVFVETVFAIPGMGRLAVTSVLNQDYPYVQAITLIISIMVLLSNLLVDIAYGWLDPRIRYE